MQGGFHIARQIIDAQVADCDSEIAGGYVFQLMRLVEDHGSNVWQNPGVRRSIGLLFDGQIGEEQVVVHDDNVALGSPAMHFGNETAVVLAALLEKTGLRARVQLGPEHAALGKPRNFGAIPGFRVRLPIGNNPELVDLLKAIQNRLRSQIV